METPKKRRSSERSCPPTALSLPVDPNGISARSVTKGQLIKMLHRAPSERKAAKERCARAKNSHPTCLSSTGKEAADWRRVRHRNRSASPEAGPISEKARI